MIVYRQQTQTGGVGGVRLVGGGLTLSALWPLQTDPPFCFLLYLIRDIRSISPDLDINNAPIETKPLGSLGKQIPSL
jgi:hypothetical protein